MEEFEDSFSERMAQLEKKDLERYQRNVLKNSSYTYDDETPNYVDEFQSKLSVLMNLVSGCINDFQRTPLLHEYGSETPTTDLQPINLIDDVLSYGHSGLRSETKQSDEVMVVNELPVSMELSDFNGIQGIYSSNSEVLLGSEENTVSEYGFKVLSIYCAHMASKWNDILEMRPTQSNDISVEIYFSQFIDWRNKLDEVSYIGGEESYINEFLYGLKTELAVRVREYEWKPTSLYAAFRIAKLEENMMNNDAPMVFDKNAEQNEENDCVVFGKMVAKIDADKVFVEMTEPVLEEDLLGIGVTKATHYMLNVRPMLSPVDSDADLYEEKVPLSTFPYTIELSIGNNGCHWISGLLANISKGNAQDLSYEDGVLGDNVKFQQLLKLEFNPQVFDPGTLQISKQEEYKSQLIIFYVFGVKTQLEVNVAGIFYVHVWLLLVNTIILAKCHMFMLGKENYDPDVAESFELNGIQEVFIEMPEPVTTTQQQFCVNDVVPNKFENKMLVGEEQTLFMKIVCLKIGCNKRISLDFGLIMSKFSTQVVINKLPTSESEMGIEFEKWHSHLVVGNCCRLFDPGGALKTNEYELLFLVRSRKLPVSINLMINKVSGHNIRFVMLVSFWHYISVLLIDGHSVSEAYEKNNVASDAFGILEYVAGTTMIFVFAMFVDFV